MVMVVATDKSKFDQIITNSPIEIVEHSNVNLTGIEESSNGMTFKYSNNVVFTAYEERPDVVYDLINKEREKTNGK